ncbi:MAG: FkbM family methyltransferase [Alphaproteobacteria bacterium]|nr:FkbM family methyltransferase [Alphaproteobacteria bacterium]
MSSRTKTILEYVKGKKTLYHLVHEIKNKHHLKHFIKKYAIPANLRTPLKKIYKKLIGKYKKVKLLDYKNGSVLCAFDHMQLYFDLVAPLNFYEIFINDAINETPYIDPSQKYNVIDMGANRGYTVLHWANQPWCKKVFAFECAQETFDMLSENVNLNPHLKDKIELYPYGLSDADADFVLYTIKGLDISATSNLELLKKTWPQQANEITTIKCQAKKSSGIIKKILDEHPNETFIFKVDVEGSEYAIFKDLTQNCPEVFDRVETLFLETHLGWEKLDKYIQALNKDYILDTFYVNGIDIHMLVYTKLTMGYWARKFHWTRFDE